MSGQCVRAWGEMGEMQLTDRVQYGAFRPAEVNERGLGGIVRECTGKNERLTSEHEIRRLPALQCLLPQSRLGRLLMRVDFLLQRVLGPPRETLQPC